MKPIEVPPPETHAILPGAQFADAYALTLSGPSLDAMTAAQRAFGRSPGWIRLLLSARNLLAAQVLLNLLGFVFHARGKRA